MRRDDAALAAAAVDPESCYLLFWNLNVLMITDPDQPALGWLSQSDIAGLGIELPPVLLGIQDGCNHFALDVSQLGDPMHELNLGAPWQFDDARRAAMGLATAETGILAQARSQLDWHRRHQFCSVCGERTQAFKGGHVRRCAACAAEHFPRTDPVAIMLITDGERCLLGQSAGRLARTGLYSALAGFIDQGESIEEAVRREVMEEAGIRVGTVKYHSSQPWPFPSSLMIGCHGRAKSTDIVIDSEEMTDVRWFSHAEVSTAMAEVGKSDPFASPTGESPALRLPGPIAIAHHLITAWLNEEVRWG